MNHVYRVVFNRALGVYQCVSELAKSRGKSASGKSQTASKLIMTPLALAMLSLSGTAMAVTYDNGQNNTPAQNPYSVVNDIVKNSGTVLSVTNLFVNDVNQASKLLITDSGKAEVEGNTVLSNDSSLEITSNGGLITDGLLVGDNTEATLLVSKGGTVNTETFVTGFENTSIDNRVTITDSGSKLTADELTIGLKGSGTLTIANGATTETRQTFLGYQAGSKGIINIDNAKYDTGNMAVGADGSGELNITNKGKLNATQVNLGQAQNTNAVVKISGDSTTLTAGNLTVANSGKANLTVEKGGVVNVTDLLVGQREGSSGTVTAKDTNSRGCIELGNS